MRKRFAVLMIGAVALAAAAQQTQGPIKSASINSTIYVYPIAGELSVPTNAAINACPTTGCTVVIPPSLSALTLSTTITISKPNIHLQCSTKQVITTTYSSTTVNPTTTVAYPVIADFLADNFEMDGCFLNTTSFGAFGNEVIQIWGSNGAKIHNNIIMNTTSPQYPGQHGLRVWGGIGIPSTNAEIYGNNIQVPAIALSTGDNSTQVNFHDNYIQNSFQPFDFNGGGQTVPDSTWIQFSHNTAVNCPGPGYVESAADVTIDNNKLNNVGVPAIGNSAIEVHTITSYLYLNVTIDNNRITGSSTTGNAIHIFQNVKGVKVTNNQIRNMGLDGIVISSFGGGTPSDVLVAHNMVMGSGTSNLSATWCGIKLDQPAGALLAFIHVKDNEAYDGGGGGQKYGICSTGTPTPYQLVITGNTIDNNVTGGLNLPTGCSGCLIAHNYDATGVDLFNSKLIPASSTSNSWSDGVVDIGANGARFHDLWISDGIQANSGTLNFNTVGTPNTSIGNATGVATVTNSDLPDSKTSFLHFRTPTCSTSTASLSTCATTAISWPNGGFADMNYTVVCSPENFNTSGAVNPYNKTNTSINIGVINLTSGTAITSGYIDCIAKHDN
jgi:hypothetical protein